MILAFLLVNVTLEMMHCKVVLVNILTSFKIFTSTNDKSFGFRYKVLSEEIIPTPAALENVL